MTILILRSFFISERYMDQEVKVLPKDQVSNPINVTILKSLSTSDVEVIMLFRSLQSPFLLGIFWEWSHGSKEKLTLVVSKWQNFYLYPFEGEEIVS